LSANLIRFVLVCHKVIKKVTKIVKYDKLYAEKYHSVGKKSGTEFIFFLSNNELIFNKEYFLDNNLKLYIITF